MVNEPQRRMDTYGAEDMAIPTWNLLQKTGGGWPKSLGGKPGQFHNAVTDELADELNIVVVDLLTGRARWGEEISDSGPVCASLDDKSNTSMNGDDCSQCPHRLDTPWTADAGERRKMCCLNYTILGITINDYMPCLVRAHGISALPVRQLLTQLKLNRALRGEYHRAVVNIKTQEKTTKYGSAFALHPRIVELITDEAKAAELKAESNRLLGAPIPLIEDRPEDEPIIFTPEGQPVYTEEEKQRVLAQAATPLTTPTPPATPLPAATTVAKEPEPKKDEGKEPTEKKLDLDF